LILCLLVISTALYTPFRVAFVEDDTDLTTIIDMIFTVGFGIDMILNFITAYFDPKNGLVTSYKLIAKEYLKWWFWIDFVAM
jgi:Ion transport protein